MARSYTDGFSIQIACRWSIMGHIALALLILYALFARLVTEFLEKVLELVTLEYFGKQWKPKWNAT